VSEHTHLSARRVTRSFGATLALRGADVEVAAGEIVALMGPSGSGKSTLLHCLAGILTPDDGEVWLDGVRLDVLGDRARTELRRERFGFVFQFGQLVPELTCLENVALPLRLDGVRRREAERRAAGWLELLEVTGVAGKRPGEVSGGEGQRVAVARALVTGPRVVFADEPTGALDSRSGAELLGFLRGAVRDLGQTVVMVTHDPAAAAAADRVVFLADGRIVGDLADPTAERVLEQMKHLDRNQGEA
jgi:putative ABC transport system ATP-binding protein